MTHLDLFSGIGGFALAASRVWHEHKVLSFVEIDPFCQKVLHKNFPNTSIHADIKTFSARTFRGHCDLLTGGFPCQPFSVAGKKRGKADDRYLWEEMLRVIEEARPRWICGENVAGIITLALDDVLASLENAGYATQAVVIPACATNAPHRRDRVWIVAHDEGGRGFERRDAQSQQVQTNASVFIEQSNSSHAASAGLEGQKRAGVQERGTGFTERSSNGTELPNWHEHWATVAARFCRVDDGLPAWVYRHRNQRLKALGNAIVPQVAQEIFQAIKLADETNNEGE